MENRELDYWILKNVMEWKQSSNINPVFWHPTESISNAFQVVEKMIESDEILMCALQYDGHRKQWRFVLRKYEEIIVEDFWPWANTIPLALCLAAKRAMESE